jgi:hypothetical protein
LEGRTQIKGASQSFSWQVLLLMVDKSNNIYIYDENVYCFTVEILSLEGSVEKAQMIKLFEAKQWERFPSQQEEG